MNSLAVGDPLRSFEVVAAEDPDRIAVRAGKITLTYGQLDREAGRLAAALRENGLQVGHRIGLRLERSWLLPVALVALFKEGLPYVPLDTAYPSERNQRVIDGAALAGIISDDIYDGDYSNLLSGVDAAASRSVGMRYIIYTSGSTGMPKGVPISESNLAGLFRATDQFFDFNATDVWAMLHSYNFDFSVWEVWGALSTGGSLVIPLQEVLRSPHRLARFLRDEGVTILNQVPTVFSHLMDACLADGTNLRQVRHLIFGGEALLWQPMKLWKRVGGNIPISNMYGITEVTVHATLHRLTTGGSQDTHRTPIGSVLPGFTGLVVNEDLIPVPPGHAGELLLSGPQVMSGYLNDPDATQAAFVAVVGHSGLWYRTGDVVVADSAGCMLYVGRNDQQVQLRGYRIELGEIEAVARRTGLIDDIAVLVTRSARGEPQLSAFVTCVEWGPERKARLRTALAELLPSYMVPTRFTHMATLPTAPSGKVDRRALVGE